MYNPTIHPSNTYNAQNRSYTNRARPNFTGNGRQLAQNYETSYTNWYNEGIVQFRPNFHHHHHHQESNMTSDDHHSGENSPPLWKNSPSPPKSPSHPLLGRHNHRSPSPNSRAQAITKGQWELMEMVKNMPESSYELSLKDLVEHHRVEANPIPTPQTGELRMLENRKQSLHPRVRVKRQQSFENRGLFLNMVFPFSLKSKKKRNFDSNSSGKVSPRPEGSKGGGGSERDWWKKRFTGSSDSDGSRISGSSGGRSSGSSGSSGGGSSSGRSHGGERKNNGFLSGCWPFFQSRKSKSVE